VVAAQARRCQGSHCMGMGWDASRELGGWRYRVSFPVLESFAVSARQPSSAERARRARSA
jgi:hypothetical protein